jgi:hypothetical protein
MSTKVLRIPASPRITVPDLALAVWVALWIALAVLVAVNTREVAKLGSTVSQTGSAMRQVGGVIGSIPFSGEVGAASQSVEQAGASAETNGADAEGAANRLGIFLGIAIALIPSMPVIGFYLPIRLARVREGEAARKSLARYGGDLRFQEFLARRAIQHLTYEEITAVSEQPWDDMRHGRFRDLATAELNRLEIHAGLPATHSEPM